MHGGQGELEKEDGNCCLSSILAQGLSDVRVILLLRRRSDRLLGAGGDAGKSESSLRMALVSGFQHTICSSFFSPFLHLACRPRCRPRVKVQQIITVKFVGTRLRHLRRDATGSTTGSSF